MNKKIISFELPEGVEWAQIGDALAKKKLIATPSDMAHLGNVEIPVSQMDQTWAKLQKLGLPVRSVRDA